MRFSRSLTLPNSLAWIMISSAVPSMPASGWWIMMRALGSACRLPWVPAAQQHGAHRSALPDAIRGHVAGDELHRVVDGQAGGDAAAGRIDVQVDVGLGVFRLQEQQLGDDAVGHFVVDLRAEEHDAVLQQAAVDVHRPLFAAALLNHIRNQRHRRFDYVLFRCFLGRTICFGETSSSTMP